MTKLPLDIRLAAPRGFCAGVTRAIEIVETCLEKFGAPVYVRHQIVHNLHVVRDLEARGAIFVEELDEVPDDRPVVFSAHGIPVSVTTEAERRGLVYFDATCPLVTKVHKSSARYSTADRMVILIGHAGHPEVIGTLGQLPPGRITLVESVADVMALDIPADCPLAYVTQTTLSVDDTAIVVGALKERFSDIVGMAERDICYATTNRQNAVKTISQDCDGVIVIGASNSSNSRRLVEVAQANGCPDALLLSDADELDRDWLNGKDVIGITAGASAPDILVSRLIAACREEREVSVREVEITREDARFRLPRGLQD